ncbi:leucine-rich repeat domain-containing protein [Formosa sp. PL04]|uniref:leucine-rich repeat domain-containing protein n=1 Tax=Formosa sp. PL04 TaxID=3081755 RepID=UPI0029817264|nr:leucine-rich repeat domain-containing protein [Formosa sp. PL04]MDW5290812.1 leucine-rich repeat domain-containing protein [Formosa sp. PL04]
MIYYIIGGVMGLMLTAFQVFKKSDLKDLETYKYLFRNDIYSHSDKANQTEAPTYQLAPVMRGKAYGPAYLFLPEREQYLVYSRLEPVEFRRYDAYAPPHPVEVKSHVLLDKKGQELQRFDTHFNYSVYSGMFFTPEFYINWLESGDTTKISYTEVYNKDIKMSRIQFIDKFRELYAQADYTEFVNLRTKFDDSIGGGVVFKMNQDWHILLDPVHSSNIYGKLKEDEKTGVDSYTYSLIFDYYDADRKKDNPYPQSPPLVKSMYLETNDPNAYMFRKGANHDGLKMASYQKLSSTGWQGIAEIKGIPIFVPGTGEGIAYMDYKIGKETIHFKIPDVTKYDYRSVYNLGVRVFKIPSESRMDNALVFIESLQNFGHYQRVGGGVYVVRPCAALDCIKSSLPEGIDEARFESLPLSLQVDLMDIEGTTQLEVKGWYPEITRFTNLTYLKITGKLNIFPEGILALKKLEVLDLDGNDLQALPPEIKELKHLKALIVSSNDLRKFPLEVLEVKGLTHLNIRYSGINEIPEGINVLTNLRILGVSSTEISLPESIIAMKDLRIKGPTELKETLPERFHFLLKSEFE